MGLLYCVCLVVVCFWVLFISLVGHLGFTMKSFRGQSVVTLGLLGFALGTSWFISGPSWASSGGLGGDLGPPRGVGLRRV